MPQIISPVVDFDSTFWSQILKWWNVLEKRIQKQGVIDKNIDSITPDSRQYFICIKGILNKKETETGQT